MKTKIWVVSTALGDYQAAPALPAVFGTEAEAEAHAERELRSEWEAHGPHDDETDEKKPYPDNWRDAQFQIMGTITDGSWGAYEITVHDVEIPIPALDRIASRLRGEWYDPSGDLESDVAGVLRQVDEGAVIVPQPPYAEVVQMLDDVSAALQNVLVQMKSVTGFPISDDHDARFVLVKKARDLCDRLLRPEPEDETC